MKSKSFPIISFFASSQAAFNFDALNFVCIASANRRTIVRIIRCLTIHHAKPKKPKRAMIVMKIMSMGLIEALVDSAAVAEVIGSDNVMVVMLGVG